MKPTATTRRLFAVLMADVVGYSRPMRDDNAAIREITGRRRPGLDIPDKPAAAD